MTVAVVPVIMIADFPYKSAHEFEDMFDSGITCEDALQNLKMN